MTAAEHTTAEIASPGPSTDGPGPRPLGLILAGAALLLAASLAAGLLVGSVPLSVAAVWRVLSAHLSGHPANGTADDIVWRIRLPRVLLAAVVGAALTTAGTVIQALVRNALADPFLPRGVLTSQCWRYRRPTLRGVGVARRLGVVDRQRARRLVGHGQCVPGLPARQTGPGAHQLILCGVVMSAMFESVTSFLLFKGNPEATQVVLFWLLGSFGNANWTQLGIPFAVLVVAMVYLLAQARSMNALVLGSEAAAALGVDVAGFRRNLFIVTSLMIGVAVAVSGVIGFVGLVVPHIVRLLVGSDHRRVLPVGVLLGASFMVVGDLLARTIVSPQEMPIGVITAFIGAPILIVLIRRRAYQYGTAE